MSKTGTLHGIWETKELSKMKRSSEAKLILDKIAVTVTPIMLRRKWKVKILKEFYPKNDSLLGMNVNHGQSILVRLRPPGNSDDFYPWEHVIGTMIHELTHMEVSPHNEEFYRLMDQIADEVSGDEISRIGRGGGKANNFDAFSGPAHRLGGGERPDKKQRARTAAEAALVRAGQLKLMSGSGSKLSTGSSDVHLTREEIRSRASASALRRVADEQSCRHSNSTTSGDIQHLPSNGRITRTSSGSGSDVCAASLWFCTLCDTVNSADNLWCSFCNSPLTDSAELVAMSDDEVLGLATTQSLCEPCTTSAGSVGSSRNLSNGNSSGRSCPVIVDLSDDSAGIPNAPSAEQSHPADLSVTVPCERCTYVNVKILTVLSEASHCDVCGNAL